jgi:hypothetical protein
MSPASAIRTSMNKGYRLRSNSQVDTRARAESIREARRKFEEKELAKEQKTYSMETADLSQLLETRTNLQPLEVPMSPALSTTKDRLATTSLSEIPREDITQLPNGFRVRWRCVSRVSAAVCASIRSGADNG